MMAKMELEGISFEESEDQKPIQLMEDNLERGLESKTLKGRIQKGVDIYEQAVKKLNTAKMWGYYLDYLIELSKNSTSLTVFKSKLLRNALEGELRHDLHKQHLQLGALNHNYHRHGTLYTL